MKKFLLMKFLGSKLIKSMNMDRHHECVILLTIAGEPAGEEEKEGSKDISVKRKR